MNIESELQTTDDGYVCTECGRTIPVGGDAIVGMHAAIERIEATGDPQNVTYQYAGIYCSDCFIEAE